MLGASDVKAMAMAENISPLKKATTGMNNASGLCTKPKAATTHRTMLEPIRLLVAPHSISPAITSSMLIGVAIIASNVFW